MDAQALHEVMGGSLSVERYRQLLPAVNSALLKIGATNVNRAAMFLAQIGHESFGLLYMEELADGSAYEGRQDLGNTQPGDGRRFKGHGWIQITGRANHTNCSRWAYEQGIVPDPDYFVREPQKLGSDQYCWVGPVWYWLVARPNLNAMADARDLAGCTRAINGGTNGLADRKARYEHALSMGDRILPRKPQEGGAMEKRVEYQRGEVHQETPWNCGPASAQTVILGSGGKLISESKLAGEMGTHQGGTDHIGQVTRVLNSYLPQGKYATVEMPNDPPTAAQKEKLWQDIKSSIDAGYGVVANIVAPPSNYPRPSYKSTEKLQYSGGTVYHYVAIMYYVVDEWGGRHVWWADSGFAPFGCWVSLDQTATLIPPKGYSYATAKPKNQEQAKEEPKPVPPAENRPQPKENWEIIDFLADIKAQLTGSHSPNEYPGWEMLGVDENGNPLTVVEALAATHTKVDEIYRRMMEGN